MAVRRGDRSLGAGVISGCEQPNMDAGDHTGLLWKSCKLLTAKPSFQPMCDSFEAGWFHSPWLSRNSGQSSCLNILRAKITGISLQGHPGGNICDNEIGSLEDSNSVLRIPERSELSPERPQERSHVA